MAYSFMLIYDVGDKFGLHPQFFDTWEQVVAACIDNPPSLDPEFNAYVIFRARRGEEYRLSDAWSMLAECCDLDMVRRNSKLGLSSISLNYIPSLKEGFGQDSRAADAFWGTAKESTRGEAPTRLSGVLAKLVSNLEGRTEEPAVEEPAYTPTEDEAARWSFYREAVRSGFYNDGKETRDGTDGVPEDGA